MNDRFTFLPEPFPGFLPEFASWEANVRRAGGFTPASISGLAAWWEPSAATLSSASGSYTATGDGTPGGYVLDRVAAVSLGGTRANGVFPTVRLTDPEGFPRIDSEGGSGSGVLGTSGQFTAVTGSYSWFMLIKLDAATTGTPVLFQLDAVAGGNPLADWNTPAAAVFRVRNSAGNIVGTSGGASIDIRGGWRVLSAVVDSVTGVGQGWVDGVSVGTCSGVGGATNLDRLRSTAGANAVAGLQTAAALVYNRAVSAAERAQIETYLTAIKNRPAETVPATPVSVNTLAGYDTEFDTAAAGVLTLSGSPATDGGLVDSWAKTAGSVAAMTEATNQPTMRVEGGVNVLEFPATGTPRLGASFTQRNLSAMTWYCVAKVTTQDAPVGGLAAFGSGSAGNPYFSPAAGPSSTVASVQFSGIGVNEPAANFTRDTHWHVWAMTFDPAGSQWRFYLDGAESGGLYGGGASAVPAQAVVASAGVPFPWDHCGVGYRSGTARPCGFRLANWTVATSCHTPAQVRAATQGFRSRYSALFGSYATDPLVVWVGSSNLTDTGGAGTGIPNATAALTTDYTRFYVTARGGMNSQTARRRVRHELPYLFAGVTGRKVACVYVGGNDFINGWSDSLLQTYAAALFASIRSAGADKIVVGTQLPRTGANDTARATYNTWLGTLVGVTIDGIADQAGSALIGENGDNANLTYYNADGIHLTAAGCAEAATYWQTAIEAALA